MERTVLINEIISLQGQINRITGTFDIKSWIDLGLTIAQLKSLLFISTGKTNFKKLAEALGVTPPNITGIIDRLVEQGLVTRNENPEDRRIMLLQTTEKGRNLLANLRESRNVQMSKILTYMDSEELSSLANGLAAFLKSADKYKENRHYRKT